jgi:capsular polysaccharide transport system ATP-binding protein
LLRLICGTAYADTGRIERASRVSWPIPLTSFFSAHASVASNIRFIARLYGVEDEAFPRRICEMVEISEFLNEPLNTCAKYVRPRLALALGLGIDFDLYLFDGSLAPADKPFKEQAAALVAERMAGRAYVLATGNPKEIGQNCDSVYVLRAGQAKYFASAEEGVSYFTALLKSEKEKASSAGDAAKQGGEDEEEDEILSDVNVLGAAVADAVD